MAKLNQIVAVANGKKTKSQKSLTEVYHKLKVKDLFDGLVRTYQPLDENGESLPREQVNVRFTVEEAIEEAIKAFTDVMNVIATQDVANTQAKADVKVYGMVVLSSVPVTTLMFLEKQLVDINTFVNHLPTLDPAYEWRFDENRAQYVTDPVKKNRTKKVIHHKVVVEPTEHHPAQIAEVSEDTKIGEFSTTSFSGAIPASRKKDMLKRIEELQEAVKFAREEANQVEVKDVKVASTLLNYVFLGTKP